MYCPNCGMNNDTDAHYCKNCGLELKEITRIVEGKEKKIAIKKQTKEISSKGQTNYPVKICPDCGENNFSYKSECAECGHNFFLEKFTVYDLNKHVEGNTKEQDKKPNLDNIRENGNFDSESKRNLFNPPTPEKEKSKINEYNSIGGILMLMGIGLVLSLIIPLAEVVDSFKVITSEYFAIYSANLKTFLYFNFTFSIFLVLFLLLLNYIFFNKKSTFPKFMISFYALNVLIGIISLNWFNYLGLGKIEGLSELSKEISTGLIKSIMIACVWTPYLLISKRVKGTFIN